MRRASYIDRKLTVEEQAIAEKYYYLISYFIHMRNLTPITDWLDRLSVPYIQSIKKYTDYTKLQCYSITTIIFHALDYARAEYFRKMNCAKRKPSGGLVYYENLENSISYISAHNSASAIDSNKIAQSNLMLYEIFQKIEFEYQKRVVIMLIECYKKIEIQRTLDITYYRLQKELTHIHKVIKKIYIE